MVAFLVTQPTAEPVALSEAKAHLRIDSSAEDGVVEALIAAARTDVERRTGRALMPQGWRIALDKVPASGLVRLAPGPVASVDAVTVYGADGSPEVVSASDYALDTASMPARLKFETAIEPGRALNGIEIDLTCGYASADDVPAPLKQAILLLVAFWFEHREAAPMGVVSAEQAFGIDALLAGFRTPRLC